MLLSDYLQHLAGKTGISGLEIGTFKGDSAAFMCQNIFTSSGSHYICVDPFTGSDDQVLNGVDCSNLEAIARERLKGYPQCEIIVGKSYDVLPTLWGTTYDFIYIDGDHHAGNVLLDSFFSWKLLEVGGILAWDDYAWKVFPNKIDQPGFAIDTFLEVWGDKMTLLHKDWHVIVRKEKE